MKIVARASFVILVLSSLYSCQRSATDHSTVETSTPINLTNPLRVATRYRLVDLKDPKNTLMVASPHLYYPEKGLPPKLDYQLQGVAGWGKWRYGVRNFSPELYSSGIVDSKVKYGLKFKRTEAIRLSSYEQNIAINESDVPATWYLSSKEPATKQRGWVVADSNLVYHDPPTPGMNVYVEAPSEFCGPDTSYFSVLNDSSMGLARFDFKIHAVTNARELGDLYLVSEFRPMFSFMIRKMDGLPIYEKESGKLVGFVASYEGNSNNAAPSMTSLTIISVMSNQVRQVLEPVDGKYPVIATPDAIDLGWQKNFCKSPRIKAILKDVVRRYRYEREKAILDSRDTATSRNVTFDPSCTSEYLESILKSQLAKAEGRGVSKPVSKLVKILTIDERIAMRFCGSEYAGEAMKDILKGDPSCPAP